MRFIYVYFIKYTYIKMHDTSLKSGQAFSESYGIPNGLVVDIGGRNVNGSLRSFFLEKGMNFICIDMEVDESASLK